MKQIGKNTEVYANDLLLKSKEMKYHVEDLREAFNALELYKMKLNPKKFAFRVQLGKFLRFIV